MAVVFKLPDLGENIESAEVVSVAVSVGDLIKADQTIIEVETDKAVTDVPAPIGGTLVSIAVGVGDKVAVGDIIATIEQSEAGGVAEAAGTQPRLPARRRTRRPRRLRAPRRKSHRLPQTSRRPSRGNRPRSRSMFLWRRVIARCRPHRRCRKFAREIGVDITQVSGSGPAGRISVDDVKTHCPPHAQWRCTGRCGRRCPISAAGAKSNASRCPTSARRRRCRWRPAGRPLT